MGSETRAITIHFTVHPRTRHKEGRITFVTLKGIYAPISPARNRVTFQIVAYLLTIDLLYALDAYHIDSVNTCYD